MRAGEKLFWSLAALAALAYWKKDTIGGYMQSDSEIMGNGNVVKVGEFIGTKESGQDYTALYEQSKTDPLYDPSLPHHFKMDDPNSPTGYIQGHPNIRIPFTLNGKATYSTAAGFFQINHPTWLEIQASRIATARGALPDFGPTSQWLGYIEILRIDGVLPAIYAADWPSALAKLKSRWASMPGDPTGQSHMTYAQALSALGAA